MRNIVITTLTSAHDGGCSDGRTCPGVHEIRDAPDCYYMVVTAERDPAVVAAFTDRIGPGEVLGRVARSARRPAPLMLTEDALVRFIDEHYVRPGDRLFRMERLPVYAVPHQSAELRRWRAGEREPDWTTKQPWLDRLADERRRGLMSAASGGSAPRSPTTR